MHIHKNGTRSGRCEGGKRKKEAAQDDRKVTLYLQTNGQCILLLNGEKQLSVNIALAVSVYRQHHLHAGASGDQPSELIRSDGGVFPQYV